MALVELTIIGGVYLGSKLWDTLRPTRFGASFKKKSKEVSVQAKNKEQLTANDHYTFISGATVLSTSIGYVLYPPLTLVNIGVITYTTIPMIDRTAHSLLHEKKLGNDALSGITALVCLGLNSHFAAALNNLIYYASVRIITHSKQATVELTSSAYQQQPTEVSLLREGEIIRVPFSALQTGDIIVVTTGDVIPCDGVVHDGKALIDQQALTGEISPCEKRPGDAVMASTLVLNGSLQIPITDSGAVSEARKLNEILTQTQDFKTTLQLKGENWSEHISLPWLGVSGLTAMIAGAHTGAALLFSVPNNSVRAALALNTLEHLQQIIQQGVFIKDGRALEQLPLIDTILFDKTGTLTQSSPEVAQIIPCAELSVETLLSYATAAEQQLQHPIANALRDKAQELNVSLPTVVDTQYDPGFGVSVQIDEKIIKVGSQRFVLEAVNRTDLPAVLQTYTEQAVGHTFIFIAVDKEVVGAIELYPKLRPEIPALIAGLRKRGIRKLGVVSGDQYAATQQQVRSLGLDEIYAEVLPHEKADLIQSLQQQGRHVCFIGDGLNDAIAMKQANVSICLAEASEIANSMAHIVFMDNRLSHLNAILDNANQLNTDLNNQLKFWIAYGAFNAGCILILRFDILQSSLLYLGAHTVSFLLSKSLSEDRPATPKLGLLSDKEFAG